jgi:transcriptional regulator with XRE-family HTH domain
MQVDVSSVAFRERLRARMRERGLNEAALARRAGVEESALRAILLGIRAREDRAVIERVAAVLDTDADGLLTGAAPATASRADSTPRGRPPAPARGPLRFPLSIAAVILVAGGTWLFRDARRVEPRVACECERAGVEVRNARDGRALWHRQTGAQVAVCTAGPWRDHRVAIYALRPFHTAGGRLVVRDLARGDSLWAYSPDPAPVRALYPDDIASTGTFSPNAAHSTGRACDRLVFADFDGDGDDDLAMRWQWEPWYPSLVEWLVRDRGRPGHFRRRGAYYTSGRVQSVRAVDVDGDGRPELLCTCTNNASAYQGAMVILLDAEHWSGASADSLALASHWRAGGNAVDSCRARVVFPHMAEIVMTFLPAQRLDAVAATVRQVGGKTEIDVVVGADAHLPCVVVTLDAALAPLGVRVTPEFRERLATAPAGVREAFTDEALAAWLAKHRRFGAGPDGADTAR